MWILTLFYFATLAAITKDQFLTVPTEKFPDKVAYTRFWLSHANSDVMTTRFQDTLGFLEHWSNLNDVILSAE